MKIHPAAADRYPMLFDPATAMAGVGMATSLAGSIMGAGAQQAQGQAAKAIGKYNSDIANMSADQAIMEGNAAADIQRRANSRLMGSIGAGYGASGVEVGQGTSLDVMSDAAAEGELKTQMILYQAKMKALAYQQQGALDLVGGSNAAAGADAAATGTLLTGLGKAAVSGAGLFPAGGAAVVPHSLGSGLASY